MSHEVQQEDRKLVHVYAMHMDVRVPDTMISGFSVCTHFWKSASHASASGSSQPSIELDVIFDVR
jgi:hypothetical protein